MTESRDEGGGRVGYRLLSNILADRIRESILSGQLVPGQQLSVTKLARQYNTSHVPVRECLHALQASGLVTLRPNRTPVVRSLSRADLRELLLMRISVESLAAREALWNCDEESVENLKHHLRVMRQTSPVDPEWAELDRKFHIDFYSHCNLPRVIELIETLRGQVVGYIDVFLHSGGDAGQAMVQHEAIMDAIANKDPERLTVHLAEHLRLTADHVEKILASSQQQVGKQASSACDGAAAFTP